MWRILWCHFLVFHVFYFFSAILSLALRERGLLYFVLAGDDNLLLINLNGVSFPKKSCSFSFNVAVFSWCFHHAVFQWMIGNDYQSSSGFESFCCGIKHFFQPSISWFFNSKCLENFCQFFSFLFLFRKVVLQSQWIPLWFPPVFCSGLFTSVAASLCFSTLHKDKTDLPAFPSSYVLTISAAVMPAFVHSHVQFPVKTERKTAFRVIKMVRWNT